MLHDSALYKFTVDVDIDTERCITVVVVKQAFWTNLEGLFYIY